jgi:hypothetical protein
MLLSDILFDSNFNARIQDVAGGVQKKSRNSFQGAPGGYCGA